MLSADADRIGGSFTIRARMVLKGRSQQTLAVDAALLPATIRFTSSITFVIMALPHHGELRDVSVLVARKALRRVRLVFFWLV